LSVSPGTSGLAAGSGLAESLGLAGIEIGQIPGLIEVSEQTVQVIEVLAHQ
jgi:hypothetical protein